MSKLSIRCIKSEKIQPNIYHGQFLIDFLKSGQGITIGNQLRRVLLNDLGGVAISAARISGIKHEFATIPGVREDVLEILLNLKGVILKSKTQYNQFGRLKIQGPKVLTADLIQLPRGLKIVNPKHYIATVSTTDTLEIELKFEYGIGYKLATQSFLEEDENYLQLDAVFMPVQKVDFKIENIHDGTNNVTERLLLDVWTNGSILPNVAIKLASQTIINLFTLVATNKNINMAGDESSIVNAEPYSNIAIEELELSVRSYNCLKKAKIDTIGDLLQYSSKKLQNLQNFGRKSADEVFSTLRDKIGITLK